MSSHDLDQRLRSLQLAGVPSISPDTEADGWLVAFAIDPDGQRTGRCLVLAGPWTMQQDQRALHQAQAQVWWPRRLEDEGQPDVEALAAWARG